MTRVIEFTSTLGSIVILTTIAVFPFLDGIVGMVDNHLLDVSLLLFGLVGTCVAAISASALIQDDEGRRLLLRRLGWIAGINVLASIVFHLQDCLFRANGNVPAFIIPTPNILSPLLELDGESAHGAYEFETYLVIWLSLTLLGGTTFALQRIFRAINRQSIVSPPD